MAATSKATTSQKKQFHGKGGRKTASARAFIKPGKGTIIVNKRSLTDYFPRQTAQMLVMLPLKAVGLDGQIDVLCTVKGGGLSGQAGAVRLAIARALVAYDTEKKVAPEDQSFKSVLRKAGLVTRIATKKERKNIGRHGSRRWKQSSKR